MGKRGKLAICIMAMMACFVMVGFGVFAATRPELQVTGTISYNASNVKVLILGKLNGVYDDDDNLVDADYLSAQQSASTYANNTVTNTTGQYLDFTTQNDTDLTAWQIGNIKFYKSSNDVFSTACISIKIQNFSDFPIYVDLTPEVSDEVLATKNIDRVINKTTTIIESASSDCNYDEIKIYYNIASQSDEATSVSLNYKVSLKRYFRNNEDENDGYVFEPIKTTSTSPLSYATWSTSDGIANLVGARLVSFSNGTTYGNNLVVPNTAKVDTNGDGVADTRVPVLEVGNGTTAISATDNSDLESVILGSFVKKINSKALQNCDSVDLALPSNLTVIASDAFDESTIKHFVISSNVALPASNKFEILQRVIIDKNCTQYFTLNGQVLFDNVNNSVVKCTKNATSIDMRYNSTITDVNDYAFYNCTNLTSLILPNSIENFGTEIFKNCTALYNDGNKFDNAYYVGCVNDPYMICIKILDSATTCQINDGFSVLYETALDGCTALYNSTNLHDGAYYIGTESNPYLILLKASSDSATSLDINENCGYIVSLPSTLTTINSNAASAPVLYCSIPTSVSNIYVADETAETAYKSASGWSAFASVISVAETA